jgi:hypothetical protein
VPASAYESFSGNYTVTGKGVGILGNTSSTTASSVAYTLNPYMWTYLSPEMKSATTLWLDLEGFNIRYGNLTPDRPLGSNFTFDRPTFVSSGGTNFSINPVIDGLSLILDGVAGTTAHLVFPYNSNNCNAIVVRAASSPSSSFHIWAYDNTSWLTNLQPQAALGDNLTQFLVRLPRARLTSILLGFQLLGSSRLSVTVRGLGVMCQGSAPGIEIQAGTFHTGVPLQDPSAGSNFASIELPLWILPGNSSNPIVKLSMWVSDSAEVSFDGIVMALTVLISHISPPAWHTLGLFVPILGIVEVGAMGCFVFLLVRKLRNIDRDSSTCMGNDKT